MSKNKPQFDQKSTTPQQPAIVDSHVEPEVETITPPVEVENTQPPVIEPESVVHTPTHFTPDALDFVTQKSRLYNLCLSNFKKYAKEMAVGLHQTPASGALHQKELYDAYQLIFQLTPPEVRDILDEIIKLFKENETGCLTESHLFRFPEHIPLSAKAVRGMNHFSHLLLTAAAVSRQEAGRLNDLGALSGWCPTEEARQLLINYFR